MSFVQTKKAGLIGQIRAGGICVGGGNCLKYLKRGGTEKRGGEIKILKKGGGSWVKEWVCQRPSHPCMPFFIVCFYVLSLAKSSTSANYD